MASISATCATSALVAAPAREMSLLSSSAAFGSNVVQMAPIRPAANRRCFVAARASLIEERAPRREILAGILAAGAALASSGSVLAASGPGTQGAKRTNEKAGELLKAADDFTTNESPPRFGPGNVASKVDDTGKLAQKAGAGAIQDIQGGTNSAIESAKNNLNEAKRRTENVFGKKANKAGDVATNVQDGVNDLVQNGPGKVRKDVQTTGDKVKSDLNTASSKIGGSKGSIGDVQKKAEDFVGQAQGQAEDTGKGLVGSIQDSFQGLKDSVTNAVPQ